MAAVQILSSGKRRRRQFGCLLASIGLVAAGAFWAQPAFAAGESVSITLTTTSDSAGRNVIAGLQQQSPVTFSSGHANSGQVITVDERTRYQQFTGGGASMTDTAGYLLGSSGAISAATRSQVMNALFQLYVGDPAAIQEPPRQLKAFQRVYLRPGQHAVVHLTLTPGSLAYWATAPQTWAVAPGMYQVYVGDSSALADLPLRGSFSAGNQ